MEKEIFRILENQRFSDIQNQEILKIKQALEIANQTTRKVLRQRINLYE